MWRESLEAALIVGILLTYLARSGERVGMRYVWAGALGAVVAAVAMGVASNGAAARLGPDAQEVLQAVVLLLAAGVLSWMVVWMHRNARQIGGDLRRRADRALATGRLVGLAALSPIEPQVWNTAWLLRDDSVLGALLGALIGYRSRPSLLEVLAFSTYLPAMGWALHRADVAARGASERGPARSAA